MRAKAAVRVVVEAPDRGLLDRAVHPFDLAVRPRVVELREAMVDAQLGAGQIKGVGSEGPPICQQLLNLCDLPAALGRRELKPVVPSEERSRQDKCFSRMGLPQLTLEEIASHDLTFFYHVADGASRD